MAASLIIKYVDGTKTGQKAVSDVKEAATNDELYNFAKDLMDLSTYTFAGVRKVVTTELTAPEVTSNG